MSERKRRGSSAEFITNWREYDAPARTKLRLAIRNRFWMVSHFKGCCGHPGEPGC
jgi:hypothetical protein